MEKNIDLKNKISTLWIIVMINMIFADILSIVIEITTKNTPNIENIQITMLVAAIITQIPILMIFLSKILKNKINGTLNIIACVLTIVYIYGGISLTPSYIFISTVEVLCMLFIVYMSWNLKKIDEI